MNKPIVFLCLIVFILFSCSSGKKALQKGDYFSAVSKAVERLKSSPDNKKASKVLHEGYSLALEWTQEEIDLALSSGSSGKWERVARLMQQVNMLSGQIRSTPAARKIIEDPLTYTTELKGVYEKAAEESYAAGLAELEVNTRESARMAFDHFHTAEQFIDGYKDARDLMAVAKERATVKVVVQAIPVNTQKYRLSSEFFFNQVIGYLNNQYDNSSFVNFYSPYQAESEGLEHPDYIVNMEFFDFSIGNLTHTEKEENLEKNIKLETKDTTEVKYVRYKAKLKTFTDKVESGGSLRVQIFEPLNDKMLLDEIIPGSFTWINDYAIFVGDQQALDKKQMELIKRKALPLPPDQDLFIEFTKPVYSQVTIRLNRFFKRYN